MAKARVLIIDDECEFATTLTERLRLRGYEARGAFTADEAIAAVGKVAPDVVLLDLNLPGVRGVELLMTLRRLLPHGEIILLSGHLDLAEKIEGVRIDAFGLLFKPVVMAELTEKIDAAQASREKHASR